VPAKRYTPRRAASREDIPKKVSGRKENGAKAFAASGGTPSSKNPDPDGSSLRTAVRMSGETRKGSSP